MQDWQSFEQDACCILTTPFHAL